MTESANSAEPLPMSLGAYRNLTRALFETETLTGAYYMGDGVWNVRTREGEILYLSDEELGTWNPET